MRSFVIILPLLVSLAACEKREPSPKNDPTEACALVNVTKRGALLKVNADACVKGDDAKCKKRREQLETQCSCKEKGNTTDNILSACEALKDPQLKAPATPASAAP